MSENNKDVHVQYGDIVTFRLIGGEELIGKYVKEELSTTVLIENPAYIQITNVDEGKLGLNLIPFMPYIKDKNISFRSETIVVFQKPDDLLTQNYKNIFGGVITPEEPSIITNIHG